METNPELKAWIADEMIDAESADVLIDLFEDGASLDEIKNKYYADRGEDR